MPVRGVVGSSQAKCKVTIIVYGAGHYGIIISRFPKKNAYSKSIIHDPLFRMTCFRLVILPQLGWDVVGIYDLNPMLKTFLAFQNTPITKSRVLIAKP